MFIHSFVKEYQPMFLCVVVHILLIVFLRRFDSSWRIVFDSLIEMSINSLAINSYDGSDSYSNNSLLHEKLLCVSEQKHTTAFEGRILNNTTEEWVCPD